MAKPLKKDNFVVEKFETTIQNQTDITIPSPHKSRVFFLIIILILVMSGSLYYYLKITFPFLFTKIITSELTVVDSPSPSSSSSANSPILTPTPIPYELPKGIQSYTFNHGADVKGPKPQSVIFDPLDPGIGSTQKITIEIVSDSPVISATVTVITDNNQQIITLQRISGDELVGKYQGSWQSDDSYKTKYAFKYLFKSNTGTFDNTMYMRR